MFFFMYTSRIYWAWGIYLILALIFFPFIGVNTLIPSLLLFGISGWLHGSTSGMALCIPFLVYRFLLCNIIYPEYYDFYEDRAFGTFMMAASAWLGGSLRSNHDALKSANSALQEIIVSRNMELNALATVLIDRTEKMRIEISEELHNGIGQEMTGIQLYCSALAEQMVEEQNPSASLAFSLRTRARQTHELVRWISRTLFPVKIGEIGLLEALRELTSCLEESKQISFTISENSISNEIPNYAALQLYRICQETIIYILNHSSATAIDIRLRENGEVYSIIISHNCGHLVFDSENNVDARLIEYRLVAMSANMAAQTYDGEEQISFSMPK